jgi:isocitrate dehydrogenase kinase/phosphatase
VDAQSSNTCTSPATASRRTWTNWRRQPRERGKHDDGGHTRHTERRLTPLNLYVRQQSEEAARQAVIDYGQAIKDLATTNIFPGDVLLKNFGVTRHGRVVFYDYDELCQVTDCKFRKIPPPRSHSDEYEADPWFYVGPMDIFPEEFHTFLGLQEPLRSVFRQYHGDLFGVEF